MQTRSHRGRRASLRLAQWSAVAAFASAACGGGGGAPATQMPGDATLDTTSTRPELDGAADANAMTAADAAGDEAESADVGADDGGLEGGVAETGTGMIGVLGQACAPPGSLACAGNYQKLQLLCDASGRWVSNGTCGAAQFCDSQPGPNAGVCADTAPGCAGQKPGYAFCDAGAPQTCGPDTVTVTTSACAPPTPSCMNGACTGCTPGAQRCSDFIPPTNQRSPQVCASDGRWLSTTSGCGINGECTTFPCDGGVQACCFAGTRCTCK